MRVLLRICACSRACAWFSLHLASMLLYTFAHSRGCPWVCARLLLMPRFKSFFLKKRDVL